MSEENIEILRQVYEALNRGDWDAVFRDMHPEFELITQRGPTAGTYRGTPAARKQVQELFGPFESFAMEPEEFFESQDLVVSFVKVSSRPKGSSADMEVRNGHLWTIRGGTIHSLKTFAVREQALEAAGLSDSDS
jgi:ketosteroid isomerase-like protein